jgi:conjugal transfer pilus assembly protein TraE
MTPANSVDRAIRAQAEARVLRIITMGSLTVSVILAGGWMLAAHSSKIIIVPPVVTRQYEIGASYASVDYLTDSVEYNNKVILRMTHPDGYSKLKTNLETAAARIKKERIATVWEPRDEWQVSEADNTVRATGILKTYIADVMTSSVQKDYVVGFNLSNDGRLYVSKIQEIAKSDPTSPQH